MDAKTKPKLGSPESAAFFRATLAELGETQSSLARLMKRHGDDRPEANILRSIQRMAAGDSRVSGEMRVLLNFMLKGRKKRITGARDEMPNNKLAMHQRKQGA